VFYSQSDFDVSCEWGKQGVENVAAGCAAVIIVDVLSFCTCVDIVVCRGSAVYPFACRGQRAAARAADLGAILAAGRHESTGYSLSPQSLLNMPADLKLLLPSPNGSQLTLSTKKGQPTFAACLRNARAVAQAVQRTGGRICVVPAGEQWPDGMLRPAAEDLAGAGALIHYLPGSRSPEAEAAVACFEHCRSRLPTFLSECASGRELTERGFAEDILIAAQLNTSSTVPVLENNAYVSCRQSN
jgi:2-phosphosulfolactate phosphatase